MSMKKKYSKVVLLIVLSVLFSIINITPNPLIFAEEHKSPPSENKKEKETKSKINISWTEFKGLLNLDKDDLELTCEEFNRLIQQTNPKFKPDYQLKEGKVLLSHDEFKKIVNDFRTIVQSDPAPIRDYLFTKSSYSGKMSKDDLIFTAYFDLIVLKDQTSLKIPVLSTSLALKNITINNNPALVINEGGYHYLIVNKSGDYKIKTVFSIKSSLDEGPHKLQFPIQQIPITLVELELPTSDIELEISSARYLEKNIGKEKTLIKAVLASCSSLDLQWKKKAASTEKVPAMIYAEANQLLSVEDDSLKITQEVAYNVLQSGVDSLQLGISEGITILSVSGPGVGDWQEIKEGEKRLLFIPLEYEQKGRFNITVYAEKTFTDQAKVIEFSGLTVLDTQNGMGEKGYIGIELKTSAELLVLPESSGLEKIMVRNLEGTIFTQSMNPLIAGFKYLKHPYNLLLDIKKHEKIALPQATIDSASAVSFFTEEGLIINKIDYAIKNQLKQSLCLKMPKGTTIWSTIVGQESVEVMQDKEMIYIPLISSRNNNQELESFNVEVIYYTESPKFSFYGKKDIILPQPDLTVSQVLWSIYLPEEFYYYQFGTNLEKEDLASGFIPIWDRDRIKVDFASNLYQQEKDNLWAWLTVGIKDCYAGQRGWTSFKNIVINEDLKSKQGASELNLNKRLQQIEDKMIQGEAQVKTGTGVLPMNIQIPNSGLLYRFAKNIVRDEQLVIEVNYFKDTIITAIIWFVILLFFIIFIFSRRYLGTAFVSLFNILKRNGQRIFLLVKVFFLSPWSLPVLGIILLFSLTLSVIESVICFFLFWTAAMIHLEKRIKKAKSRLGSNIFMLVLFILLALMFQIKKYPLAYGEEQKKEGQQVSLDWNEFKRVTGLDKDELFLTWDEFQKIIGQTSKKVIPIYTLQNGRVRLKREQFDSLLNQMILPSEDIPPIINYRLTKASYKGKMTEEGTTISAELLLEVQDKNGYKAIPFLSAQLALEDVLVNDQPGLILSEGGLHKLVIKEPGSYKIKALFYLKTSLNDSNYQLSIPIEETAITLLELEMPFEEINVKVPQAQQVNVSNQDKKTVISAIFPPGRELNIQWYTKKVTPVLTQEKLPAKIYATSYSLVSIDDDALKINMDIEYNILHAAINELDLLVPEGLNLLSVKGDGVGEWRELRQDKQRILHLNLDYEHKGIFWLTIGYEKNLLEATSRFSFSTIETLKAVKEIGYLGLELKSSAEVKVIQHDGLEKLTVQKLPQQLFNKSLKPLIHGFKYLKHPYSLELDIQRHPKVTEALAVIDSANAVSFFTEDGKIVNRIVYEVRNQLRQYLKIQLPEQAEVWSVFVGDKPAEPAREKDMLYIQLIRSQQEGGGLKPFKVEMVYYQKDKPFSNYGKGAIILPKVDEIIVSKILWSLYLPRDYNFLYFGGTLEKERLASGLRPILGCSSKRVSCLKKVSKGGEYANPKPQEQVDIDEDNKMIYGYKGENNEKITSQKEFMMRDFKKNKISKKDVRQQYELETDNSVFRPGRAEYTPPQVQQGQSALQSKARTSAITSNYDTAVMSIPISIPLSGQVYRFAKNVVRQEPLIIDMVYTKSWIISLVSWFGFFIFLGILFALRKKICKIGGYCEEKTQRLNECCSGSKILAIRAYNAPLTPLILIGFFIAASITFHPILAILIAIITTGIFIHQKRYWVVWKEDEGGLMQENDGGEFADLLRPDEMDSQEKEDR
ncbi:MAG: hypothetical protein V1872_09440 [bacterium]